MSAQMLSWGLGWLGAAREAAGHALVGEVQGQAQGQLAIIALHNSRVAIAKVLGKDHDAVREIDRVSPDLKDCRDMLCHFEAYVDGKGKLQSKPLEGRRVPWTVMWTGTSGIAPQQELVALTHTGGERELTSFVVNIQDTLKVVARAVMVACDESGRPGAPAWVHDLVHRS